MKQTKKPGQAAAAPAKPAETAVAAYDWSQTGVSGFENVQREDLGIPFLIILQKGNPEIDKTHKEYATKKIEGADVGDIVNTITREICHKYGEEPMQFIPCSFEKLYMEWKPREQGGGMVKAHKNANILNECTRNDKNQDVLRNGNIVVTTAYFYGLQVRDDGSRVPCVIGMSSTQLKKARLWLNMAMGIKLNGPNGKYTPPIFSHIYNLTSTPESNEKGSWMGWKVEISSEIQDPTAIADAIDCARKAAAGQRTALPPAPEESNDNVPFA